MYKGGILKGVMPRDGEVPVILQCESLIPNKKDDGKVTYTTTVDKEMFPYPPGSEVVVRDNFSTKWEKDIFLCHKKHLPLAYRCVNTTWRQCHPLATHGHLLGTTYRADTPACAKCGKAAPDNLTLIKCGEELRLCKDCFYVRSMQPTALTADGVKVKEGDTVWHPDYGKASVRPCDDDLYASIPGSEYNNHTNWCTPVYDCYSRPCARLANRSVAMVGDRVETPNGNIYPLSLASDGALFVQRPDHCDDILASECYPIGSRITTPEQYDALVDELAAITAERDSLRDEMDALKKKKAPARTKKKTGEPLSGLCATCYAGELCEYNGQQSCASYTKTEEPKPNSTPSAHPGEFQPFLVIVRDKEDECWKKAFYGYANGGGYKWRHVLLFDGNEHLLGTSDSPK